MVRHGHPRATVGLLRRAVRARRLLVVVTTLATVAGAIAFLQASASDHVATARMLITPLSPDDPDAGELGLIRSLGDPTRTTRTAAALIESDVAARRTAGFLGGGDWTPERVREHITVEPLPGSSIVEVSGRASSPRLAARLTNAFAGSVRVVRRRDLARRVDAAIARVRGDLRTAPPRGRGTRDLEAQLTRLISIQGAGDSTVTLTDRATAPRSPGVGHVLLTVLAALVVGLALAAGGALLCEQLDPGPLVAGDARTS